MRNFRKVMSRYAAFVCIAVTMLLTVAGCQSAVRKTMYSAYESVGIEKRDILKSRVDDARDEQKDAAESFEDALTAFKKMYAFDGGKLEKQYSKIKDAYEDADKDAKDVRASIAKMDVVAKDLFKEWSEEASKIETSDLKKRSLDLKAQTETKYAKLHAALKKSESRMDPVLKKLSDQVLFLKHNLNAKAIASLQTESGTIQKDIERLVEEMKKSIQEAEKFIAELD